MPTRCCAPATTPLTMRAHRFMFYVKDQGNADLSPASDPHEEFRELNILIQRHSVEECAAKFGLAAADVEREVRVRSRFPPACARPFPDKAPRRLQLPRRVSSRRAAAARGRDSTTRCSRRGTALRSPRTPPPTVCSASAKRMSAWLAKRAGSSTTRCALRALRAAFCPLLAASSIVVFARCGAGRARL